MTSKVEYHRLQKEAGLSNRQAAKFLGVGISTIKRWRSGENQPPKTVIMCLESLVSREAVEYWGEEE